jgi:uncharacterized protein YndB with AHSA1/START domain
VTAKKLEIIAEPGKTSFTTTRVVDAPRALVFEAFTKCEHLKRWMGPCNVTMVSCETDLRPGGRYRFVFRSPDGNEAGFSGEFREVVRPERIVRTFVFEPIPDAAATARAKIAIRTPLNLVLKLPMLMSMFVLPSLCLPQITRP